MKRLLLTFATLVVFAFAMGGVAHAGLNGHYYEAFSITKEDGGMTSATLKDGTVVGPKTGNNYITDPYTWSGGKVYHFDTADTHVRQQKSETQLGLDSRKLYSDNYYHVSYFDLYNTKGASGNMLKQGTAEFNFKMTEYANSKNAYDFNTSMDFYLYETANGGYWLMFSQLAWSLGRVTDANGAEYEMYLRLKDTPTFEEAGYTNMKLHSEYADMLKYFNFADGQDLFGFYIPDGEERHIAFTLGGYGDNVNPYAAPIPGAVWLMGSGVAGLIALRRRSQK